MSNLLEVNSLNVQFNYDETTVQAVKNVSFELRKKHILGIVGESGSGKSITAKSILGLLPDYPDHTLTGEIIFNGQSLNNLSTSALQQIRGKDISMIFQDPFASINPRFKVIDVIKRPLIIHGKVKDNDDIIKTVVSLLEKVGLDQSFLYRYPHELSGGQRQRVSIARALAVEPKVIVCDEAVSALDVSIQKDIIELLKQLQLDFGITYLFITHDMGVINEICDRVAVMKNGEIVELNNTEDIIKHPQSDYAKQLISEVAVIAK
ncbi:TPA: ABC transporter ATP-binding protein [Staphylococcus aureus]|nr:Putative glutathione transporter, ATP-binding component [Staphylococcus aureus]HAY6301269.1 ABC transporter ATP-binding protein [Staphylococcus aureus]HAY6303942.1 ABC transporter ATP-binding protein [Staphylococcus aureus]HAY6306816.1 ABC transporter ATP-binding protein [Staphylococcus aureus]HAY6511532.1 ABC transporter ATP-binding protein [Staphylococcus aureus]